MNAENPRTWEQHWSEGHTPWDAGRSAPSLDDLLSGRNVPAGARALVPGCGSGYDVFTLAKAAFTTLGIDVAPSTALRFNRVRDEQGLSEDRAMLHVGDFFELTANELGGTFDFIWDYTFYCAIEPNQRDAWREQMARLLSPSGELAMLLFPVTPGADPRKGPPYPLDPEEVSRQLSPRFHPVRLEPAPHSHLGREGKEWISVWNRRS